MAIFKGENIGDTLKARIGPAPVWVYGILVVLGMVWYMRRRKGSSSSGGAGYSTGLPTEVVQGGQMPYTQLGDTFVNVTVNDTDKSPKPPKPPKKDGGPTHRPPKGHKPPRRRRGPWEREDDDMKDDPIGRQAGHPHRPRRVPRRHTKASSQE